MRDVNESLTSKFLGRNGVRPDPSLVCDVLDSIEKEFLSVSSKTKKNIRSFVPTEISSNKDSINRILKLVPQLEEVDIEEVKWLIRKISDRLYEYNERN